MIESLRKSAYQRIFPVPLAMELNIRDILILFIEPATFRKNNHRNNVMSKSRTFEAHIVNIIKNTKSRGNNLALIRKMYNLLRFLEYFQFNKVFFHLRTLIYWFL